MSTTPFPALFRPFKGWEPPPLVLLHGVARSLVELFFQSKFEYCCVANLYQVFHSDYRSDNNPPPPSPAAQNKRWIDEAFAGSSSVEAIVQKLEARASGAPEERPGDRSSEGLAHDDDKDRSGREWAQETLSSLAKASPTALKVFDSENVSEGPSIPPSRGYGHE